MNAAEYLIGFFEAGTTDEADRQGYRFPDVVQALSEVESAIDSWESMGVDVHLMRSCLERWKKSALNTFMDVDELRWDMSMFTHAKTQEKLTDGDLMGLQSVAEKTIGFHRLVLRGCPAKDEEHDRGSRQMRPCG